MRFTAALILPALIICGCSGGSDESADDQRLSGRERDSVLAESGIPGAGTAKRAIAASDSASARSKRLDELTE
ncbi:MAG: hypothetical protein R6U43_10835 [Candidatus Krumholzibacteriales bacterium]